MALTAGLLALGVAGCGANGRSGSATATATAASAASGVTSASCSESMASAATACVFVLTDGRRFRCPQAVFGPQTPTPSALTGETRCVPLHPLVVPAAMRAVFAALGTARACLAGKGLGVTGGPVFPPSAGRPEGPDGELIVGDQSGAAFVAFYRDLSRARRLEADVIQSARRLGGQTQRQGAVTVVWVHSPSTRLRAGVEACALG